MLYKKTTALFYAKLPFDFNFGMPTSNFNFPVPIRQIKLLYKCLIPYFIYYDISNLSEY